MLHLADRHRLVPYDGPIDARTEIAELLLPDLFPANGTVDAALYAGIIDDLELALDLLDGPTLPIRALLPSGRAITLVTAPGVDLTALGLKTGLD
ncbi:hypothetical protein [Maritimibacter fusiformis]|nr:hypothetical protein [Maritimibacter fusiformis]